MDFDSSDNASAKYSGKVKTQTFKQFQLDKLIKEGKVIPASKLAEAKATELQRIKDFEEAATVEERQQISSKQRTPIDIKTPLTRERLEEWVGTNVGTRENQGNKKPSNSLNIMGFIYK